uniref:Growth hormone secretagogue receptor type 1 n=1 Tax=Erpetoichthys calabaricus TaxID=27687 RepID=A0A8C4RYU2_ERPCA
AWMCRPAANEGPDRTLKVTPVISMASLVSLFPLSALIPITIICILLFCVGVCGNTMTILIIRRYKDMKTTTNLYLSSMAVSDLIILLCLPFDLYRLWKYYPWIFGEVICRLFHYINEGCTYATILHITALSIERYLAICFPLKAKVFVTRRRVKYAIVLLWTLALSSAAPMLFLFGVQYENSTHPVAEHRACKYTAHALSSGLLDTMIWMSTLYFIIPMTCLTFLYGSIGWKLWRSKTQVQGPHAANRERYHKQTVKILAVVVLAFAICWLPFHIGRYLFMHFQTYYEMTLSQYFNMVSMHLFYLSASINPVLYNLMSKKYRAAAYRLLLHKKSSKRALFGTREDPEESEFWTRISQSS